MREGRPLGFLGFVSAGVAEDLQGERLVSRSLLEELVDTRDRGAGDDGPGPGKNMAPLIGTALLILGEGGSIILVKSTGGGAATTEPPEIAPLLVRIVTLAPEVPQLLTLTVISTSWNSPFPLLPTDKSLPGSSETSPPQRRDGVGERRRRFFGTMEEVVVVVAETNLGEAEGDGVGQTATAVVITPPLVLPL